MSAARSLDACSGVQELRISVYETVVASASPLDAFASLFSRWDSSGRLLPPVSLEDPTGTSGKVVGPPAARATRLPPVAAPDDSAAPHPLQIPVPLRFCVWQIGHVCSTSETNCRLVTGSPHFGQRLV